MHDLPTCFRNKSPYSRRQLIQRNIELIHLIYIVLKIHHGSYKYKDVDTVDSVMLIYCWKKFIDVLQFILNVVTCIQASSIKVFDPRGCAVYWHVFCMQLSPTQDVSIHSTGTRASWMQNFDNRCLYAYNHRQHKQWILFKYMSASH